MDMKYEAPEVVVLEVEIEKGFSASLGFTDEYADDNYDIN